MVQPSQPRKVPKNNGVVQVERIGNPRHKFDRGVFEKGPLRKTPIHPLQQKNRRQTGAIVNSATWLSVLSNRALPECSSPPAQPGESLQASCGTPRKAPPPTPWRAESAKRGDSPRSAHPPAYQRRYTRSPTRHVTRQQAALATATSRRHPTNCPSRLPSFNIHNNISGHSMINFPLRRRPAGSNRIPIPCSFCGRMVRP